jgi:hypothetical protein
MRTLRPGRGSMDIPQNLIPFLEVTTMNLRRLAALAGILAITGAAFHQARSADPPDKKASSAAVTGSGDFAERYARANLRLAELRLQKAQEMNRRVARTLAQSVVELFADDVEFAQAQLKSAQSGGQIDSFDLWLRRAQLELQDREKQLNMATTANQRVPNAFAPIDLARIRAGLELAKLRVDRGRELADAPPPEKLAWQLEMMNEGLNRVDIMVSLAIQNRLAQFF